MTQTLGRRPDGAMHGPVAARTTARLPSVQPSAYAGGTRGSARPKIGPGSSWRRLDHRSGEHTVAELFVPLHEDRSTAREGSAKPSCRRPRPVRQAHGFALPLEGRRAMSEDGRSRCACGTSR